MRTTVKIICLCFLISIISCKESEQEMNQNESMEISNSKLERVEPPHWWIGFKDQSLQLLIKDDNIGAFKPEINYSGVSIEKVHSASSKNYLFIDLKISDKEKAGNFDIEFSNDDGVEKRHTYELKERLKSSDDFKGFDSSDAIFLITPDRFANGDESIDIVEGLKETIIDRTDGYGRHGGDLRGIISHLDYIEDLGYTAVWPTPVLINDMPKGSYHGYAITDYYKVDPRFGALKEHRIII